MSDRLESLFRFTSWIAAARSERDVLSVLVVHGAPIAGATAAVVGLVESQVIRVAAEFGYPAGYLDPWRTFPLDPGTPMSDVVELGQPVYCSSRKDRDRRWPACRGTGNVDSEAFVVLPLAGYGGVLGALTLSYPEQREFDREERAFLEALSAQCALALERTRATAGEQRLSRWLGFLSDASKALSNSLDFQETLAEVGRLLIPRVGDWFACDLLVDGKLELVAVSHRDPAKVEWARMLRDRFPTDLDASAGVPNVLRTGRSELHEEITAEWIAAAAPTPEGLAVIREFGLSSLLIVPLIARDRILGALTLAWAQSGRHYDEDDLIRAEELATRVAVAIDNARLYREGLAAYESERIARSRIERLQRFTARLAPALTVERVIEVAIDKALVASGGKTAVFGLATESGSIELTAGGEHLSELATTESLPHDHQSVFGEVFRRQEPLWLGRREEWEKFPQTVGRPASLRAVAALPVATATRFFGALAIAFDREREFPIEDRNFLMAIAGQTAQALDRARLYEEQSHIAHVLQQSLLPRSVPSIPGVEIATSYRAAGANETGGDFYDVFETDSGHVIVIGDVCGKGAVAASLTALCRYTLRACALLRPVVAPSEMLRLLNRAILEHGPADDDASTEFASVTCVLLQADGDELTATIASGGHPATLIRRSGGAVEAYEPTGALVGFLDGSDYGERTVSLEPGDLVFLYTDGLIDARDEHGGRFGERRIRSTLSYLADHDRPGKAIEAFEGLLDGLEITDDVAIVAIQVSTPVRRRARVKRPARVADRDAG